MILLCPMVWFSYLFKLIKFFFSPFDFTECSDLSTRICTHRHSAELTRYQRRVPLTTIKNKKTKEGGDAHKISEKTNFLTYYLTCGGHSTAQHRCGTTLSSLPLSSYRTLAPELVDTDKDRKSMISTHKTEAVTSP